MWVWDTHSDKEDFDSLKKRSSDLAQSFHLEIRTQRHGQEITRLGQFIWLVSECTLEPLRQGRGSKRSPSSACWARCQPLGQFCTLLMDPL